MQSIKSNRLTPTKTTLSDRPTNSQAQSQGGALSSETANTGTFSEYDDQLLQPLLNFPAARSFGLYRLLPQLSLAIRALP